MDIQLPQSERLNTAPRAMVEEIDAYDVARLKQSLLEHLGDSPEAYPVHLEQQFPRILAKIVELWGKARLDAYLQSLMVSDRPCRQGFPSKVAAEIFRLSVLHGSLGISKEPVLTGWASVSDSEIVKYFKKSGS